MDIRNFGQKSIDEVKAKLEELGPGTDREGEEDRCQHRRKAPAWAAGRPTSG